MIRAPPTGAAEPAIVGTLVTMFGGTVGEYWERPDGDPSPGLPDRSCPLWLRYWIHAMHAPLVPDERQGLLSFLQQQRQAVRHAVYGLSDNQGRARPTASGLSLGGLVKHLAYGERRWSDRIGALSTNEGGFEYMDSFALSDDETLLEVLQSYEQASARTDDVVRGIDDLGRRVPLPDEPWFPDPDACTVRWIILHLIEETARHAGHADIIRESLDGAQSGPLIAAAEGWPEDGWVKPWRPTN